MYDIVDIRVLVKNIVQLLLVGDVALYILRPLAAYQLDAIEDLSIAVIKVVDDHNLVVGFEQREGGEGANVARAAVRVVNKGVVSGDRIGSVDRVVIDRSLPCDENGSDDHCG